MALNPSIILAGTQPDFVNILRQSTAGAAEAGKLQQENALRDLYQTQGAGIAAGDQNALNALAQFDPRAALQIQGDRQGLAQGELSMDATRLGMDATRQRMDVLSREEQRAVEKHALSLSTAERAQQADQIRQGLMQGVSAYQTGDLNAVNQILQQAGEQPIQSLDQFPAVASKYQGVLEAMEAVKEFNAGPGPQSPAGKLAADLDAGRITPEQYNAANQKSGMRVSSDGDGGFTFEQGPGVTGEMGAEVGNSASSELDKSEIKSRNALSRLDRISSNLQENPDVISAQTLQGNIRAKGLEWKDYITGNLSDADAQYLTEVTQQRGDILENLNFTIQEITGAAMGVEEAKRIGATMPNVNDSPTVFKAKLDRAMESTRMAVARYNYWRNSGLEGDPMGIAPLSEMKSFMKDRASEVYKEELAGGDPATARERTKARLTKEFGIE